MNIIIKIPHHETLPPATREAVETKLAVLERFLGNESETALLEVDLGRAPAEGRSSEPWRLIANLSAGGKVYHADAVKPTPESAADRVRNELESEIRRSRGRTRDFLRRGGAAIKKMLRGWR